MRHFTIVPRWQMTPAYLFGLVGIFALLALLLSVAFGRLDFIERYSFFLGGVFLASCLSVLHFVGIATSAEASDSELSFKRWHRPDVQIPRGQVLSLTPSRFRAAFFNLKHRDGVVVLSGRFTGFHEFINAVKAHSPDADLRGC